MLRPNQSLSWRDAKWVLAGVSLVSLSIAAFFWWRGAWPVVPFSGLEVLALIAAIYISALRGKRLQIITCTPDKVYVEKDGRGGGTREEFPRNWAQVVLDRDARRGYPSRLRIRSHGRAVDIGEFLNEGERLRLAAELRRAIAGERAG